MIVSLQLVANGGDAEGLFRAAIMQSGAPLPIGDLKLGQKHYDDLVLRTSCIFTGGTLDCLRSTPYETLKAAVEASIGILDYRVRVFATKTSHLDSLLSAVHGTLVDTTTGRSLHIKYTDGHDSGRTGCQSSSHKW